MQKYGNKYYATVHFLLLALVGLYTYLYHTKIYCDKLRISTEWTERWNLSGLGQTRHFNLRKSGHCQTSRVVSNVRI